MDVDGILRAKDLKRVTGLSRTTVWRLERDGKFPRRRAISASSVGWFASEIRDWLESRPVVPRVRESEK